MRAEELDFDLPEELIAQVPAEDRAASRLLHYRRADRSVAHGRFAEIADVLQAGDLLVFNDARVVPARLTLRKESGGLAEGLFLAEERPGRWRMLLKNIGGAAEGRRLAIEGADGVTLRVVAHHGEGEHTVEVVGPAAAAAAPALVVLERAGRMPLPPYIRRAKHHDARDDLDRARYQTVYAKEAGSVAAPTAGLHFTPALLAELERRGVLRTSVTLHVGMGTFKPVTAETLEGHRMHVERYAITAAAAEAIDAAKREGRRVIAVGTTACRVLESQPAGRPVEPISAAETGIFIYPPYRFHLVDALVTNFHLPRSTLIALVAALTGLEEQRRLYRLAVEERYRFFSYGDAMFVE